MEQMNITSVQRQPNDPLTDEKRDLVTVIDGVTMHVPEDPANRHYAEIMRQVEAGELTIQDAE